VANKKLKCTLTNFCESLGEEKTLKQIDSAFETWQSVSELKFKRVEPDEDCEIKITFLKSNQLPIQTQRTKRWNFGTRFLSWKKLNLRRYPL